MVILRLWTCLITLAALFLTVGPQNVSAKEHRIEIVAQIFEPAQMFKKGEPAGFAADLMKEIRKRVQTRTQSDIPKIDLQPWHRAYHKVRTKPNTLMFSIVRSLKREEQFIRVGKISIYDVRFYSLGHQRTMQASSLRQFVDLGHRFGVPDMGEINDYAKQEGYQAHKQYETYAHYSRGVRMLFNHRLKAIPLLAHNAKALVCLVGFDGERIHSLFRAEKLTKPLWVVFSKGTSPEIVVEFQKALKEVQDEKMDVALRARYISEFKTAACRKTTMLYETP